MSERNAAADVSAIRNAVDKIGNRLRTQREAADNEETTKTAFILPFLRDVLGYNVENPFEVKPEYTADIGHNKGEKVDYAILNDDSEHTPRILIECKKLDADLTQENAKQLWRYFDALHGAHFGILTNGRLWQFYTDMDNDNVMDDEPYAVLNVLSPDPDVIVLLQDITKKGFDSGKALEDAERYRKMKLIRRRIDNELSDPSLKFVKLLAGELVAKGTHDHTVETEYKPLVEDALKEYINQRIKSRLEKAAMDEEGSDSQQRGAEESDDVAAVRTGTAEPGEVEREQPERKRRRSSVKMQDLVNAGLLRDGDELISVRGQYRDVVAMVRGDGKIEIEGQRYKSPSGAAESVTDHSEDGWKFWELRDGRTLDDLRDAYGRGSSVHD
ncbi:MAG: type I restriction enzyme HsdR N-terminal domain-containing protein [Bifidobacteriaceae bacterium]|nr:type I restriction enzyme HsdR N-terminal domain-containing protein [Bifidobacteriaceae bacterium]